MGKGIEMAKATNPDDAAAIQALDDLKDQLLIALVKRLGGDVSMPVSEVDDTGSDVLSFSVNKRGIFRFITHKKN